MATPEEIAAERVRRGYWIRRARLRLGLTLDAVAEAMGYGKKSGSSVSLWENGHRPVPSDKFGPLAALLQLPPRFLVKPPLTDDERLERAVNEAGVLEREDWEAGEAGPREADAEPDAGPRRRSA